MNIESIVKTALIVSGCLFGLYMLVSFIILEYRNYQNSNAPVFTEPAVAYFKHPETQLVNQGRTSGDVHFITFHTDNGEICKLYMTAQNFYSIPEGSRGILTWQGERFWKFEIEE